MGNIFKFDKSEVLISGGRVEYFKMEISVFGIVFLTLGIKFISGSSDMPRGPWNSRSLVNRGMSVLELDTI